MFSKYLLIASLLLLSTSSLAAPFDFSYSGRLTKDSGEPIEGAVNLQVKFYRVLTGGEAVPVEIPIFSSITLDQGIFHLDFNGLTDAKYHQIFSMSEPTFIEVTDTINNITYPRQKFSIVPFALKVPVDDQTIGYNPDGKLTLKNSAEAGTVIVEAINSSSGATLTTGSLPNLSGDVSGTVTSASVNKIRGRTISDQTPNNGEFLSWDAPSSSWKPIAVESNSGGTVTSVGSGMGLTGGPITGTGTLSLATSGVTAGTYTKVTVDTYGRATSGTSIVAGDLPGSIDAAKIGGGAVSNTEFGYLDGVTSAIQTQLNGQVVGPTSATDNAIARFDGTTGKIVQNSGVVIDDSGNVGIGQSPTAKLEVSGNIKVGDSAVACNASTEGQQRYNSSTKKMEFCNASSWTSMDGSAGAVPPGAIAFFNRTIAEGCPSGWTKKTSLQGRYIVGMIDSGTPGTTVGSAFTSSSEDRAVGQHSHSASQAEHSHNYVSPTAGSFNPVLGSGSWIFAASGTGIQTGTSMPIITVQNEGLVAGTNAPYVQYLACEKQ